MLIFASLTFYPWFYRPSMLVFDSNHCLKPSFPHRVHNPFVQLSKNWYVRQEGTTMQYPQKQNQLNYCVNASLSSQLKLQYGAYYVLMQLFTMETS
jgi:hypothetical protein